MTSLLTSFYLFFAFLLLSTAIQAQPPFDCVLNTTHCSCDAIHYTSCPFPTIEERSLCYGFNCTGYQCLPTCDEVFFVIRQCEIGELQMYRFMSEPGTDDTTQDCTVDNVVMTQLIWEATPTRVELAEVIVEKGEGFMLKNGDATSQFHSQFIGDVNNDGFNDIAIGASSSVGVAVIFGSANPSSFEPEYNFNGLDGTNGFYIAYVGGTGNRFGDVISYGDINGDNITDLIITESFGDPNRQNNAGIIYVVFGKTGLGLNQPQLNIGNLDGTNGFRINGYIAQNRVGTFLSVADVNNDGFDDIVLGSVTDTRGNEVFVVFGKPTFNAVLGLNQLDGSNGFAVRLDTVDASIQVITTPVASIDINGDGFADIIIGLRQTNQNFIIYGRPSFSAVVLASSLDGSTGYVIDGPATYSVGDGVWALGDLNNDGLGDFSTVSNLNGTMFVIFGSREPRPSRISIPEMNLNGRNGMQLVGNSFGSSAAYGDLNGDGIDDIVVGARNAETYRGVTGKCYIFYGQADGLFRSYYLVEYLTDEEGYVIYGEEDSDTVNEEFGRSVSVMEWNQDGFMDILVSARFSLPVRRSYVFYGKAQ